MATNDEPIFPQIIKAARIDAGLSQSELAERMGTEQPGVARIERGDRNLSEGTLARVARGLGVSVEELLRVGIRQLEAGTGAETCKRIRAQGEARRGPTRSRRATRS